MGLLKASFLHDCTLEFAPYICFKILTAECLAMLGHYPEAQSIGTIYILRMDSTNGDALYVQGFCFSYEDCIEKAVQFLCKLS